MSLSPSDLLWLASRDIRDNAGERAPFMLDQGLRFLERRLSSASEGT